MLLLSPANGGGFFNLSKQARICLEGGTRQRSIPLLISNQCAINGTANDYRGFRDSATECHHINAEKGDQGQPKELSGIVDLLLQTGGECEQ